MIRSEIKKEIDKLYHSGNQQLIEPILHLEETKLKLEKKKKNLQEEIEKDKNELRIIAKQPFNYLELHRKHSDSIVFSGTFQIFLLLLDWIKKIFIKV